MTESLNTMLETQDIHSLGHKLKTAREALNLSIEDVAKRTNLKKSHIESLENDIFILQNVAPTFVRGYVRNYLRFLRLPEEWGSTVNYGEVKLPNTTEKSPSPKAVQKSQTKWVKYLTVLILLGAVGMTLLWWWQDYQKQQESRDQFVSTAVENSQPVTLTPQENNSITLPTASETAPVVTSEPVVTQPITDVQVATQPTETMPVATEIAPVANTEQPTDVTNVLAEQTPTTEPAPQEQVAVGNDELRIEITGKESWITVRGATGKKSLAEKLYTNGEVLTFNGNEQYRLTIGAPANVKLYYKGQLVPLKIDGRVARIKLPLAQ